MYPGHERDLSESRDFVDHVTIRLAVCDFLLEFHLHQPAILNCFRDIMPDIYPGHDLDLSGLRDSISNGFRDI